MTLTPEERAKAVYEEIFRVGKFRSAPVPFDPASIIASAIRAAENDALERAAGQVEQSISRNGAAAIIRALKHKD